MNREDFTFFRNIDQFAYLDNAASSQTPDTVIDAMDEYYKNYKANIHRGVYEMSEKASTAYDEVRVALANMIGAKSDDIILTAGSTMSSNMLIYMLEQYIKWDTSQDITYKECEVVLNKNLNIKTDSKGIDDRDSIITTYYEHNSIALPIIELAKRKNLNIKYIDHAHIQKEYKLVYNESLGKAEKVEIETENDLKINNIFTDENDNIYKLWSKVLDDKVKIINMTMASNVTGEIFDIESHINIINKICQDKNIKRPYIICDATAILGHHRFNVKSMDVDAMWAGAHKMCGPTGVGMLYIKRDISRRMSPHIYGGGMVSKVSEHDAQYRSDIMAFEAGTANISGVIGWGAAIKYIESIGLRNIETHIKDLHIYMIEKLSALPYIKLYTSDSKYNVGIVSFSLTPSPSPKERGVIHPHDIAHILSDNGVAVRAGHHCAPLLMKYIDEIALTRASIYLYNTKEDIDLLINGIEKAWKKLG